MKKIYEAKKNFWIGEINKEIKSGVQVEYDDDHCILVLHGNRHEVKNLKAAIKAEWLVPMDGVFPKLDGPVGETELQAIERRRHVRLEQTKVEQQSKPKLPTDETALKPLKKIHGCINEGTAEFMNALGIEPPAAQRGKFKGSVVEDDTKIVEVAKIDTKEVKQIKKALGQDPKEKVGCKDFQVYKDSFDDGSVEVGKYTSVEQIVKNWSGMHWTKKDDIIRKASKEVLKELKVVESSKKIKERIQKRLEEAPSQ